MNINLSYYDACYKLCTLTTILRSQKVNEIAIDSHLSAKTESIFDFDDGFAGFDYSEFKITFFRDGKVADEVRFNNDFKKALHYQQILYSDGYTMDLRLQAMKVLSPSLLTKFLKSKPMLTASEMASVIATANELEAEALGHSRWSKSEDVSDNANQLEAVTQEQSVTKPKLK